MAGSQTKIGSLKVHGPDDMRAVFYQKCCNVTGKSTCSGMIALFSAGQIKWHIET